MIDGCVIISKLHDVMHFDAHTQVFKPLDFYVEQVKELIHSQNIDVDLKPECMSHHLYLS